MEGDAMDIAAPHPFEGDAVTPHAENNEPVVEDHAPAEEVTSAEQLMAVDSEETEQDRAATSSGEDEEPGTVITTNIEKAVTVVDGDVETEATSVEIDKNLTTTAVVLEEPGSLTQAVDNPFEPVVTADNGFDSGWGNGAGDTGFNSAWVPGVTENPQEPAAQDNSSGVANNPFSDGRDGAPKDSDWGRGRKDANRTPKTVSWNPNGSAKSPSFERGERTDNWGMNPERAARIHSRNGGSELLPPLGRVSPQKVAQRAARRATAAPYNYGARDRDNMRDQSSPEYLDYGGNEDSITHSFNGNQKDAPKLDLVARFKMMDMSSFGTDIMSHMRVLAELYAQEMEACQRLQAASIRYPARRSQYDEQINAEKDTTRKARLIADLAGYKAEAVEQQNYLEITIKTAKAAQKTEMDAMMKTVASHLSDKIQASVSEVMRAIGGPTCDVPTIIQGCVNLAAPQLLRDYIPTQDDFIRVTDRKIAKMNVALKEKDATIASLSSRIERIEKQLQSLSDNNKIMQPATEQNELASTSADANHPELLAVLRSVPDAISSSQSKSTGGLFAGFVSQFSASSKKLLQ